jgi:hypothetical protein
MKQFPYKPKLLLVIFCYCSYEYIWAAKLIRGALPLDIFFSYWFKGIRALFYVTWFLLSEAQLTHVGIFGIHCNSLMVSAESR